MTIEPKSSQDVSDLIIAQIEAELSQTIPLLPKAFIRVLAKALGGVYVLLYKYCGFIFLQLFVDSASNELTTINGKEIRPLNEYGVLVGVGEQTPATAAEFTFRFIPILPTGASTLSGGTPVLSDSNGVTYVTVGDVSYGGGGAPAFEDVTVRAASDQNGGNGAGVIGNLDAGETLSFVAPPANIERDGTIQSVDVVGADEEDIDVYRARIKARFQTPPQGGAYADYAIWGETVAGIVNVYPYTGDPGQVDVYSEVDTSIDSDGIPNAAKLTEVYDAIELDDGGLASRRPANAYVNSLPISRTSFEVQVEGLTVDNETEAQTAIETEVENWFLDREPYIPGWSVGVRKDQISEAAVAGIVNDVVASLGGLFTGVQLLEGAVSGTPFTIRTLTEGEKAKAATVTFT